MLRADGAAPVIVVGASGLALGIAEDWAPVVAAASAIVALVAVCAIGVGRRPKVGLTVSAPAARVARDETVALQAETQWGRPGRWIRLETGGPESEDSVSIRLPRRAGRVITPISLDTRRRGRHPVGPFVVSQSDPWRLFRRELAGTRAYDVLVVPRVWAVSAALLRTLRMRSNGRASGSGGDDFHGLRDYVYGDEVRTIHWRSSARAGQLLVRTEVAVPQGTLVVLDCDSSAYDAVAGFDTTAPGSSAFEAAVDVAASLALAPIVERQVPLLAMTELAAVDHGPVHGRAAVLDALGVVQCRPPSECAPGAVWEQALAARVTRLIVVTGNPGPQLRDTTARFAAAGLGCAIVQVGDGCRPLREASVRVPAAAELPDWPRSATS